MPDTPPPRATDIRRAGDWDGAPADRVTLDYDARFLRRKRLTAAGGTVFVADLAETVSLDEGDVLVLEDGRLIEVAAAPELLVAVTGANLARLAWHIGNRHTPCQIGEGRLVIRHDHVLEDMLAGLGATLQHFDGPFRPEGGAYGQGRTMGHSHGRGDHAPDAGHHHHHHHGHGDATATRQHLSADDMGGGDGGDGD